MTNSSDEFCELISKLAKMLEGVIIRDDDSTSKYSIKDSRFTSSKVPKISVENYLKRIFEMGKLPEEVMIATVIYIKRFSTIGKYHVTIKEIHRLIAGSFIIAVKFYSDDYYDNKFYAKLAGISLKEINKLERSFLKSLKYQVYISEEEYERCLLELSSRNNTDRN